MDDEREIERQAVVDIKAALDGVAELMNKAGDLGIEISFNIARGKRNRFEVQGFAAKKDLAT